MKNDPFLHLEAMLTLRPTVLSRSAAPLNCPLLFGSWSQHLALSSSKSCISLINPLLLLRPLSLSLHVTVSLRSWSGVDMASTPSPLKEAEL